MAKRLAPHPDEFSQTWFQRLLSRFLARDASGSTWRLIVIAGIVLIYWLILALVLAFPRQTSLTGVSALPFPLDVLLDFARSMIAPRVLIHVLPVLAGLTLGIQVAAHYLADLVELYPASTASRYLLASLFGMGHPSLEIAGGEQTDLDETHPMVRIGGPGLLTVHLGFAAVSETINGFPHIIGPAKNRFVQGFERLRDIVDLRDQLGKVDEVRAVTRDGIEVYARDAQMMFRVYGADLPRNLQSPYPYDDNAVRKLVYGRAVTSSGPRPWSEMLAELVKDEIRAFVAGLTIEEFLALQPRIMLEQKSGKTSASEPQSIHIPRRHLTERFHTPDTRKRLQDHGLELAWVGVGTWEVRDPPSHSPLEAGPGETIVTTWRDLQRARLYRNPEYLQRQRDFAYQAYTGRLFREYVGIWESEEGDYPTRCWLLLAAGFLRHLQDMQRILTSNPQTQIPLDFQTAVEHVRALVKPESI
jgi:hypothetical protein